MRFLRGNNKQRQNQERNSQRNAKNRTCSGKIRENTTEMAGIPTQNKRGKNSKADIGSKSRREEQSRKTQKRQEEYDRLKRGQQYAKMCIERH